MNGRQSAKYGRIDTWVDIMRRHAACPVCDHFRVSAPRRGPGNGNARATAARLRGQVMAHMRAMHGAELAAPDAGPRDENGGDE